jgi:hypothetical protein
MFDEMLVVGAAGRTWRQIPHLFKLEMKLDASNYVGTTACTMGSMFSLPAPIFGKAWSFSLIFANIQQIFRKLFSSYAGLQLIITYKLCVVFM